MDRTAILDFIHRRFHEDNHWVNGNCYWAAWILCEQFPELSMYYCAHVGHFVAGDGTVFFDGHGQYVPETVHEVYPLSTIKEIDSTWYSRLMRDCRN